MPDASDLVLVHDGRLNPSCRPNRAIRAHEATYRRHANIGAIINSYPVNVTAFGVTGTPVDSPSTPESYLMLRDLACLPFRLRFAEAEKLAHALAPERPSAMHENDGVVVAGSTML